MSRSSAKRQEPLRLYTKTLHSCSISNCCPPPKVLVHDEQVPSSPQGPSRISFRGAYVPPLILARALSDNRSSALSDTPSSALSQGIHCLRAISCLCGRFSQVRCIHLGTPSGVLVIIGICLIGMRRLLFSQADALCLTMAFRVCVPLSHLLQTGLPSRRV